MSSLAPPLRRIHVDTDFGGNPDDACALTMLLGWPGVEVVGITTTADPDGRRAGYVARILELLSRPDIPVAVGAGVSGTTGREMGAIPDHVRFWGSDEPLPVRPDSPYDALDLLDASLARGATLVAIGPYTNLAAYERARSGRLADAEVVVMGGWLDPLGTEFPSWGPRRDWNVVCDLEAAELVVASAGRLTLATIPGTIKAQLCGGDLARLRGTGPVGRLLARQSLAHGADNRLPALAKQHVGLHDDLVSFHWDPVACATALDWPGVQAIECNVRVRRSADSLRLVRTPAGRQVDVVVDIDAAAFTELWLTCLESAQRAGA